MRFSLLFTALVFLALSFSFVRAEDTLDTLLADYKKFDLPLPPVEAKLVHINTGWSQGDKEIRTLGFLLKAGAKGEASEFQIGTLHLSIYEAYDVVVGEPTEALAADAVMDWMSTSNGGLNVGLPLAIQCHTRGWEKLAKALLDKSLDTGAGHHFSMYYQPANLPPRIALATIAFAHYGERLYEKDDWKLIVPKMQAIAAADKNLDTEFTRTLLSDLQLSIQPSTAKPGSVEALIDSLVTEQPEKEDSKAKGAHAGLTAMGFDAVPALIEHLNDHRRTHYKKQGFNNFPTWQMHVGDVVGDILQSIAGDDLGKDWLRRQQGWEIEKADVEKWFEGAKANEGEYLVKRALAGAKNGRNTEWPNAGVLRVLAAKFPRRLLDIYRDLLDNHPNMQSHPVVTAITGSSLPAKDRIETFVYAGHHKNLEHRRAAFWALKDLDPTAFVELLLATLMELPVTPAGAYWSCSEVSFFNLVGQTSDKRAWEALLTAARRADPGFRMQLIQPSFEAEPGQRRFLLTYLANFIDDTTIRDTTASPEKFDGPFAGFELDRPRRAMWEQAAESLCWILRLRTDRDNKPNKKWTEADWEKLRTDVKDALKRENIGTSFEDAKKL